MQLQLVVAEVLGQMLETTVVLPHFPQLLPLVVALVALNLILHLLEMGETADQEEALLLLKP
jgi:hypothetical protein